MGCRGWGNTELKYYNLRDMISETHDSGARLEVVIMNGDRERHTTKEPLVAELSLMQLLGVPTGVYKFTSRPACFSFNFKIRQLKTGLLRKHFIWRAQWWNERYKRKQRIYKLS